MEIIEKGFDLIKFLAGTFTVLSIAVLILLSMPKSKFRGFVLEVGGWVVAVMCAIYVPTPTDIVPDVIPVVGWADDLGVIGVGIAAAKAAMSGRKERKIEEEKEELQLEILRNQARDVSTKIISA